MMREKFGMNSARSESQDRTEVDRGAKAHQKFRTETRIVADELANREACDYVIGRKAILHFGDGFPDGFGTAWDDAHCAELALVEDLVGNHLDDQAVGG